MNKALSELGLPEVDWLPTKDWKEKLKLSVIGEDPPIAPAKPQPTCKLSAHGVQLTTLRTLCIIGAYEL
eukprot:4352906-Amphidinium_carterae.1